MTRDGDTQTLDARLADGWRTRPLDHGLVTEALATVIDTFAGNPFQGTPEVKRAWRVLDELYERMKRGSATIRG